MSKQEKENTTQQTNSENKEPENERTFKRVFSR